MPSATTQGDIGTHHPREAHGGVNEHGYREADLEKLQGSTRRLSREIEAEARDAANIAKMAGFAAPTADQRASDAARARATLLRSREIRHAALREECPVCATEPNAYCSTFRSVKGMHRERYALGLR